MRSSIVILVILIPYFLCVLGPMHNICGYPRAITLNSEGKLYDCLYVHDQESYGAKWLKEYGEDKMRVYTDFYGTLKLISQAGFWSNCDRSSLLDHKKIEGYIYLGYYNVVNDKLMDRGATLYNLTEYDDVFVGRDKIYNSSGAEIWK